MLRATADPKQLEEAFRVAASHPKVVGMKLYAGVSTGHLSLTSLEAQRQVYRVAAKVGYAGVIAVHCEEESLCCSNLFVPEEPRSWNWAKPPIAEIVGVKKQIRFATEEKFVGHLHIAHTSTPEAVLEVYEAKQRGMAISCGVTPHHLSFFVERDMATTDGMKLKVNPPIRERMEAEGAGHAPQGRKNRLNRDGSRSASCREKELRSGLASSFLHVRNTKPRGL